VPQYAAPPTPPKSGNPLGATGFTLSLLGILAGVLAIALIIGWFVGWVGELVEQAKQWKEEGLSEQEIKQRVEQLTKKKMEEDPPTKQAAIGVTFWVGMGLGTLGLILSIVGLAKKNAKKGLAIAGLVLGCITGTCLLSSLAMNFAQWASQAR
jgi:hypothetical protein